MNGDGTESTDIGKENNIDIGKMFNSDWYLKIVFTVIAVALCVIAMKMTDSIYVRGDVDADVSGYVDVNGSVGIDGYVDVRN